MCLSVCPSVLAEESTQLEQVVVTADRKARTVDETLTPVTVITRKDIEKYQATDVAEVLRRVPGINIANGGGAGKATSVFMRGTESKHVLVLVDGVKVGSATLGSVAFQHIPLEQVERIEVVRGPRSSLYGSEAIGGVIQIFTRKGKEGFQPELTLQAGSNNTQAVNTTFAGGDKATWYNMSVGSERTSGINAQVADITGERDGYERKQAAVRVGHNFANGVKAEVSALQADGDTAYDNTFSPGNYIEQFTQEAFSGKVVAPIGTKAIVTAQIGKSKDAGDNFKNGAFISRFVTDRDTASLQADVQVSEHGNLTIGTDKQKDTVDSTTLYTVKSRKNDGIFANYQHDFGKTDVEVSVRRDDNEQFGKHNTGAVAVGYDISDNLRLKASQGKAFRAPTFNELYYPASPPWVAGGDPNLKPEQSKNTEIGLDGKWANGKWSVSAFDNKIDNMISGWPPTNTAQAEIKGVEFGASTQLAGWDVSTSLIIQSPKDKITGKPLTYRPKQIVSIDVDRQFNRMRIGTTLRGESKRDWDDSTVWPTIVRKQLPGYGTVDLRADYQLAKDWTVGAKIGNVLDKDYQTNSGYNQDGINGLVTLKYAPK
ncbi:MAG: hypothetical protein BWK73_30940 [Thiothrix lacustris]|uniref:TonB-dependent receptor n=1 Tax=Thiothrix lacustris TaxID=525917 RepID=A0A1Y1QIR1_9GAMM|nr:MAG: hypothetical protein BWK73_30940 [Thiothrix lacustris]